MGVWHNRIIFDFFYSEYWHNGLVLSLGAKAEVHSLEERVGMRLSDCILCVSIYCNLPDLLHRNAGNERVHAGAGNVSDRILPGL